MNEDADLLRRYADSGGQEIFATLVQRYLRLVYGAAFRRVQGDVHRAQDITQQVFVAVSRNASALTRHPDFTGWLFTTTRFIAAKTLRAEQRRQQREQEHYMTESLTNHVPVSEHSFGQVAALLDEVVMELRQRDRQILLLRFHRGLKLAEIGTQLNTSENAIQKRLERALEQVRSKLARRGVTSAASAVVIAFEHQGALAVPAGLGSAVTAAALAGGVGTGGLFTLAGTMTISKLHVGLAAAVLAAASGGAAWIARDNAKLRLAATPETSAYLVPANRLQRETARQPTRAEISTGRIGLPAKEDGKLGRVGPSEADRFKIVSSGSPGVGQSRDATVAAAKVSYADFFFETALTAGQQARFASLVAEKVANRNALVHALFQRGEKIDRLAVQVASEQTENEFLGKLEASLGQGLAERYKLYDEQKPIRIVVNDMVSTASRADAPMSAADTQKIMDVISRYARNDAGKVDMRNLDALAVLKQLEGLLTTIQLAVVQRSLSVEADRQLLQKGPGQ